MGIDRVELCTFEINSGLELSRAKRMELVNQTHGVLSTLGAVIIARETSQSSWGHRWIAASVSHDTLFTCEFVLVYTHTRKSSPDNLSFTDSFSLLLDTDNIQKRTLSVFIVVYAAYRRTRSRPGSHEKQRYFRVVTFRVTRHVLSAPDKLKES